MDDCRDTTPAPPGVRAQKVCRGRRCGAGRPLCPSAVCTSPPGVCTRHILVPRCLPATSSYVLVAVGISLVVVSKEGVRSFAPPRTTSLHSLFYIFTKYYILHKYFVYTKCEVYNMQQEIRESEQASWFRSILFYRSFFVLSPGTHMYSHNIYVT